MFNYIKSCFRPEPKLQKQGVLVGLDCAGKSSLLHKLSSEVVSTIPTIGFHLETVSTSRWNLTCWDVGGCDRSRPLWGQQVTGADFLLYLQDASDHLRLLESLEEMRILVETFAETPGKHVFVLLNKVDKLEKHTAAATLADMRRRFESQMKPFKDSIHLHVLDVPGLNCRKGHQLATAMSEIRRILLGEAPGKEMTEKLTTARQLPPALPPTQEHLIQKIQQAGKTATDHATFWDDFKAGRLSSWDHYAHLRAGYFVLLDGSSIAECVDEFLAELARLRASNPERFANTSHRTMTAFWLVKLQSAALEYSVAEYATKDLPAKHEFQEVLLHSPHLMNAGLWHEYYSREVLFSPEARQAWRKPDLQPLPGIGEDPL